VNLYQSLRDYEEFIYTLPQQFSSIVYSTLVVVRRGGRMVTVSGEIVFSDDYRLVIKERLTFDAGPLVLKRYGYELWHTGAKLYWYDSAASSRPRFGCYRPTSQAYSSRYKASPYPRTRTFVHPTQLAIPDSRG
jgi:hypothetical protein